jgi:hypothetical protein
MVLMVNILKKEMTPEEYLELKRAKHFFVQWLISGNRRKVPQDAKPYLKAAPDEAKALFEHFQKRLRQKPKGKKNLFANSMA